ncbi:MarR family winged helix-turn-helix transcriptional regulator [Burkholderia sp. ISTR5]|uniref:MarR family winged helix-turn-helix transcriptional regulator n=1 Tax=Burkholderia sp. ISTR5 TaxID=2500161 RepID=UPI001368BE49|nr:MarR family transcriptional regulator [Burkholderia sp. ISTR5]NBI45202.1 MarR family transcriptional regulator [Burkholderia sp. ISTR5]
MARAPRTTIGSRASDEAHAFGRLLLRADLALHQAITRCTQDALQVTAQQARVLYLVERPELNRAADISRQCEVDPKAITCMVDRLVRDGFLQRRRGTIDRRVVELVLTARGHAVAAGTPAAFREAHERLFAGFEAQEMARLATLLQRILER